MGTLRHHYNDPLGWEIFEEHPDAIAAPVGKGGIVVFSSLSPHLTGPNTTDAVRKAYILQYAPDGARVLRGDETQSSGVAAHENVARVDTGLPPTSSALADDVVRQFPVLIDGQRVEPEPLPLRRA